MDVDDDAAVHAGVAASWRDHGRIDALVAAAGWGVAGAVEHTIDRRGQGPVRDQLLGLRPGRAGRAAAMRAQGGGRIVLLSSIGGVIGIPFQAFYSASKFALEGFAEALAYEVAPFGVQVTLVQPGNIDTDFTASRKMADGAADDPSTPPRRRRPSRLMERDEANGAPAGRSPPSSSGCWTASRPPRRVSVGKADERVGLVAKRLLPFRVFEAGAKGSLGVS